MMVQRFMEGAAIVLGAAALALIFAPELALARLDIVPMPLASFTSTCPQVKLRISPCLMPVW